MVFTLFIPVRAAEKEYVNDRSTDTAQKIEFNGIACIFMIKFKKTNVNQNVEEEIAKNDFSDL